MVVFQEHRLKFLRLRSMDLNDLDLAHFFVSAFPRLQVGSCFEHLSCLCFPAAWFLFALFSCLFPFFVSVFVFPRLCFLSPVVFVFRIFVVRRCYLFL